MFPRTASLTISLALLTATAPHPEHQRVWSVTVLGDSSDARAPALREALQHWNEQLTLLKTDLQFGPITWSDRRLSERALRTLSDAVVGRRRVNRPAELDDISGDVIVAFAQSELRSVGIARERFGRALVVLRPFQAAPFSLPNVGRNIATHELGHVLGLPHNGEPGTLMCGPPFCTFQPRKFQSDSTAFLPLTETERRFVAQRWH